MIVRGRVRGREERESEDKRAMNGQVAEGES